MDPARVRTTDWQWTERCPFPSPRRERRTGLPGPARSRLGTTPCRSQPGVRTTGLPGPAGRRSAVTPCHPQPGVMTRQSQRDASRWSRPGDLRRGLTRVGRLRAVRRPDSNRCAHPSRLRTECHEPARAATRSRQCRWDGTCARRGSPVRPRQGVRTRSRSSPAKRCSVCAGRARSAGDSATRARDRLELADHDATGGRPGVAHAGRRALGVVLVPQHGAHAPHARGGGRQHGGADERLSCQRRPNSLAGRTRGHHPGATTSTMPRPSSDHPCEHRGGRRRREHRRERPEIVAACRDRRREHGAPRAIAQVGRAPAGREAPARRHRRPCGGPPHRSSSDPPRTPSARAAPRRSSALPRRPTSRARSRSPRREPTELAHHQRTPLPIGQLAQIRDQQRQSCPLAGAVLRRPNPPLRSIGQLAVAAASTNQRDRLVVRDPKQPRTQRRVALPTPQRHKRARERRLQRVLRVGVLAHNRAAIAIKRLVIALVDRRERPLAAAPDKPSEPLVPEQRNPDPQPTRGGPPNNNRRRIHDPYISATPPDTKSQDQHPIPGTRRSPLPSARPKAPRQSSRASATRPIAAADTSSPTTAINHSCTPTRCDRY